MQFLIEWHKLSLIALFPPSTTQYTRTKKRNTREKYKHDREQDYEFSNLFSLLLLLFLRFEVWMSDLENNVIETKNAHTQFLREQWAQIRAK